MLFIKIIFISLCILQTNTVFSQEIQKNDNFELSRITFIDKDSGNIKESAETQIRTSWRNSAINDDSSLIVYSGNLIKHMNGQSKVIALSGDNSDIASPQFSDREKLLTYWDVVDTAVDPYVYTIRLYDTVEEGEIYSHSFSTFPYIPTDRVNSSNASTVIFKNGVFLYLYRKIDNGYEETILDDHKTYFDVICTKSGNRVFYFYSDDSDQYTFVYRDKNEIGWSKEIPIQNIGPLFSNNDSESLLKPETVSIHGDQIILSDNIKNFYKIKEVNGKWSAPEFIGNFKKPDSLFDFPIYSSDDARVIAIQQPKMLYPDKDDYVTYDLIVYICDSSGKWKQHRLNPDGIYVVDGILLSSDGDEIFWIPSNRYSQTEFETLK